MKRALLLGKKKLASATDFFPKEKIVDLFFLHLAVAFFGCIFIFGPGCITWGHYKYNAGVLFYQTVSKDEKIMRGYIDNFAASRSLMISNVSRENNVTHFSPHVRSKFPPHIAKGMEDLVMRIFLEYYLVPVEMESWADTYIESGVIGNWEKSSMTRNQTFQNVERIVRDDGKKVFREKYGVITFTTLAFIFWVPHVIASVVFLYTLKKNVSTQDEKVSVKNSNVNDSDSGSGDDSTK